MVLHPPKCSWFFHHMLEICHAGFVYVILLKGQKYKCLRITSDRVINIVCLIHSIYKIWIMKRLQRWQRRSSATVRYVLFIVFNCWILLCLVQTKLASVMLWYHWLIHSPHYPHSLCSTSASLWSWAGVLIQHLPVHTGGSPHLIRKMINLSPW